MDLNVSTEDTTTLIGLTEGWITGLQLAALSLQGGRDTGRFVANFAGSHRHILDYLTEEVLSQQDDPIRDFLVKTSVLAKLTAPLCDAVLGVTDSRGKTPFFGASQYLHCPSG